jgi:hypothetical protein
MNLESFGNEKNDFRWKILQQQVQEKRIGQIFKVLNENHVEAILLKGWAAARNYPQPFERVSVDVDVAVRPESFADCANILRVNKVVGYDLHKGLSRLDTVDWSVLYARAEQVKIGEVSVKILSAEDHLRVLCAHWLGDGGAGRERLWDIFYAVRNRRRNFDWNICLNAAGAKRRNWIVCALGLAEKYLKLDLNETPVSSETKSIPAWVFKTVEKEWRRGLRLKPLHTCLGDGRELYEQIKLRLPPNPIQATIENEAIFDESVRLPLQIRSMYRRFMPGVKKIKTSLSEKTVGR